MRHSASRDASDVSQSECDGPPARLDEPQYSTHDPRPCDDARPRRTHGQEHEPYVPTAARNVRESNSHVLRVWSYAWQIGSYVLQIASYALPIAFYVLHIAAHVGRATGHCVQISSSAW